MNYDFQCVKVERLPNFVYHVQLNRPTKLNALDMQIWNEIGACFEQIAIDPDCRVVVLSGAGKAFCVGIDLKGNEMIKELSEPNEDIDPARRSFLLGRKIRYMQKCFTNVNECPKPVIVVTHGYCLGAGVDLIAACDMRWSSRDTIFSIKEVDVGIVADIGTLNRIGKICGNDSWIRELAYSAKNFTATDAERNGLVSRVFETKEVALKEALTFAESIALKSPLAVQGTKINLNYSRDHTVADSMDYVATWNQSQLFTEDIAKSAMAALTKSEIPPFSKL